MGLAQGGQVDFIFPSNQLWQVNKRPAARYAGVWGCVAASVAPH